MNKFYFPTIVDSLKPYYSCAAGHSACPASMEDQLSPFHATRG
ncbi:hypothetical protein HMPREF3038_02420 [Akkermansia sp. KLE1797]|nr:hypothetical protein HMPREF3038_02420 [Akkermansia sp. KLE1797]KXU54848.1 hypothetical protein HMPREF3039_00995 [Akkermansia sp. KLE1798]KZA06232.1 hypothetical protein HMPREF1326_00080 [Akkermansia sp. KLE1605]